MLSSAPASPLASAFKLLVLDRSSCSGCAVEGDVLAPSSTDASLSGAGQQQTCAPAPLQATQCCGIILKISAHILTNSHLRNRQHLLSYFLRSALCHDLVDVVKDTGEVPGSDPSDDTKRRGQSAHRAGRRAQSCGSGRCSRRT